MKSLVLALLALLATAYASGEGVQQQHLRHLSNGKGTKRSASSARGKPELFRSTPNVCVCDPKETCDCECNKEENVLSCGCYASLINKDEQLETECGGEDNDCDGFLSDFWGTIRDDILMQREPTEEQRKLFDDAEANACWAELGAMLIKEDPSIQDDPSTLCSPCTFSDGGWQCSTVPCTRPACSEAEPFWYADEGVCCSSCHAEPEHDVDEDPPKFQAIIRKIKIKSKDNYRSTSAVVEIVGPRAVSDINVKICVVCDGVDNDCDGICSAAVGFGRPQISHTFASNDFGLTIADDGGVKVTGELIGSVSTFTAKLGLEDVGAKLHDFLGDGSSQLARIVVHFMAYGEDSELLDISDTDATASLNKLGDVVMLYGDIIIGGMPIDDFYD